MNKPFALVALLGFLISLAVHVLALCGVDVMAYWPSVWGLHIGIFLVFIPFILSARKTMGARPKMADFRAAFPPWVNVLGGAILIYAFINFALFMMETGGGSPEIRGGKYVLLNHGKLIRELTQAEYTSARANVIRGFSGHWLVFYFAAFSYFMFFKKPAPVANAQTGSGGI